MAGIVSAEAIALMEEIVRSMATAKLILVTAAVLFAGLITAGAGVLAYSPPHVENPACGRPTTRNSPTGRGPFDRTRPAPSGGHETGHGSRAPHHPGRSRGSGGTSPVGVDVLAAVWYSRSSGTPEMLLERTRSSAEGQARIEIARERPDARVSFAYVWAYQPGRAIATKNIPFMGKASPPLIHLTLAQPANWTITVLGADDRPIAGLRLAPHMLRSTVGRGSSIRPFLMGCSSR